jgi:hypothetical protein
MGFKILDTFKTKKIIGIMKFLDFIHLYKSKFSSHQNRISWFYVPWKQT